MKKTRMLLSVHLIFTEKCKGISLDLSLSNYDAVQGILFHFKGKGMEKGRVMNYPPD